MTPLPSPARDLSERLSARALDVCRTYLSNGRRCGSYWSVGDVRNSRGRSLFVRLSGPPSGKGAAGRWTDMATGEHGDLLDLLRLTCSLSDTRAAMDVARRFLALPRPPRRDEPDSRGRVERTPASAERLFAMAHPVPGTLAERYLRARGITAALDLDALRYHPRTYHRRSAEGPSETWPALLAAVTDPAGRLTGVHRTWLDRARPRKAPLAEPKRSLGHLLGNGVRFGRAGDVVAVGEGLETVLSVRSALPLCPMIAATSAGHLGALVLPERLRRLYIAVDRDRGGRSAADRLRARAEAQGIEVVDLVPTAGDFNDDLRRFGSPGLRERVARQLASSDFERFGVSCA
jgi:hypothetical protein